jgi:hypothetical protein
MPCPAHGRLMKIVHKSPGKDCGRWRTAGKAAVVFSRDVPIEEVLQVAGSSGARVVGWAIRLIPIPVNEKLCCYIFKNLYFVLDIPVT